MKKIVYLSILASSLFVLGSCKKAYGCSCTIVQNNQTKTDLVNIPNSTEKKAESQCNDIETQGKAYYNKSGESYTCELVQ